MDEGITIIAPDGLPEEWLARIKPELAPGERLIWAGQSKRARAFSGRAVAMIWAGGFATLGLLGFAGLFGQVGPLAKADHILATLAVGASSIALLIVTGLIGHGLGGAFDRAGLAANLYALTDARAIAWTSSGPGVTVQSIRKGAIKSVHRVEYADGSGLVVFNGGPASFDGLDPGFQNVPDVRRVEALVRLYLIGEDRGPSTN